MDCDNLVDNFGCISGFCECFWLLFCFNRLMFYNDFELSWCCVIDFECLKFVKCCNGSCVINNKFLKLNLVLLVIVIIIGVFIFFCFFCCCLSRMKSERYFMKIWVVKGKLKRVYYFGEDVDSVVKSVLVGVESEVFLVKEGKDLKEFDVEDEVLIFIIIGGFVLVLICEEDEEDDGVEKV